MLKIGLCQRQFWTNQTKYSIHPGSKDLASRHITPSMSKKMIFLIVLVPRGGGPDNLKCFGVLGSVHPRLHGDNPGDLHSPGCLP